MTNKYEMPTISDVARLAQVSKTTVSRVLNRPGLVNADTRKRVLQVIADLQYAPSVLARGMRSQKTKTFGVVIPDFKNLFYAEFLEHVENAARGHGYIAVVCSTDINPEREKEYINELLQRQIDGLIMCWYKSVSENRSFLLKLAKRIPVVVMDQPSCGLPVSAVYTDGLKGIKKLTSFFLQNGHRKIGLIKSLHEYPVGNRRFQGYVSALEERGIEIDENLIQESEWTPSAAFRATGRILEKSRPTAMIGVTDLMAIGVLEYLNTNGFSVPKDIAVAGFDNIFFSTMVSPRLTTVAQPIDKMAWEAVGQLIRRIENRRVRNRDIELENRLIVRESSGVYHEDKVAL
jgi:LacI family transcriptional regulator